jgi:hypothetical protein
MLRGKLPSLTGWEHVPTFWTLDLAGLAGDQGGGAAT